MNSTVKTAVFWVVMLCTAILLWQVVRTGQSTKEKEYKFSEFRGKVVDGSITSVVITNEVEVEGKMTDGSPFKTVIPPNYPEIINELGDNNVTIEVRQSSTPAWASFLLNALPFILLFGFWIFMMRQMQAGGNKALSFGKSRARLLTSQQKKVTFKDVAGVEEAKEELHEIIEFLREPQKFQKLGGPHPEGRPAGRTSRYRKDAARSRGGRRSQRSVLLNFRLGLRRNVRRRRSQPRSRPI